MEEEMSQFAFKSKHSFLVAAMLFICSYGFSVYSFAQASPDYQAAQEMVQVNINEADADTLAAVLQGVGASRARAIVEYREEHGPFTSIEELVEVNGIGEATLRLNLERLRLD